jgi:hypothetical protein
MYMKLLFVLHTKCITTKCTKRPWNMPILAIPRPSKNLPKLKILWEMEAVLKREYQIYIHEVWRGFYTMSYPKRFKFTSEKVAEWPRIKTKFVKHNSFLDKILMTVWVERKRLEHEGRHKRYEIFHNFAYHLATLLQMAPPIISPLRMTNFWRQNEKNLIWTFQNEFHLRGTARGSPYVCKGVKK